MENKIPDEILKEVTESIYADISIRSLIEEIEEDLTEEEIYDLLKAEQYDKIPVSIDEINDSIMYIENKKKLEKEKEEYYKQYPGQDFSCYGDKENYYKKYKVDNPKTFSEHKPDEWSNGMFFRIYLHKNEKWIRFIRGITTDYSEDFWHYTWLKEKCCMKLDDFVKFGALRNAHKILTRKNIDWMDNYDDPYDALEDANNWLVLGAKRLHVFEVTQETECGFYYDNCFEIYD